MNARAALLCLSAAYAAAPIASHAADTYPSRPIRVVVPFAPAGINDVIARILGQRLGENLGTTIVVDNRAGAGGTLGSNIVAQAPPDGYTLLFSSSSTIAVSPNLYKNLPYDPIKNFSPISQVASVGSILRFGGRDWHVTGVFDAAGSAFDSEVWADGDQLMQAFRRQAYSAVVARISDSGSFDSLKARLEGDPRRRRRVGGGARQDRARDLHHRHGPGESQAAHLHRHPPQRPQRHRRRALFAAGAPDAARLHAHRLGGS